MLALSRALRDEYSIAAVTNDIFTRWDSFILYLCTSIAQI